MQTTVQELVAPVSQLENYINPRLTIAKLLD
jgi:hypothetical protein